jgi:Polyketide cyclase / dehydrase and lipid transport
VNHVYKFACSWAMPAPPEILFATLQRLDLYPQWWQQVKVAERIDDDTCRVVVQSRLPLSLRMTAHRSRVDARAGLLEARLTGDLMGFSRWVLTPASDGGTLLAFSEEVEAVRPLLRHLGFARPLFEINHRMMMRAGERGLRKHLSRPT